MSAERSPDEPGNAMERAPLSDPWTRPVAGFFLDLLIAVVVLFGLTLACGAAWGAVRGVQQVMQQGGSAMDAASVIERIGQPGAIAVLWITLISTGGAALLLYFWRRRASVVEFEASKAALGRASTWVWVLLTAVATFGFSSAVSWLGQRFGTPPEPTNLAVIEAAYAASPGFMIIFGVLIAPAYEELLFRRVLFGRLWYAGRPLLGLALSAAAFALVHEIPGLTGNGWQATVALWLTYGFMGAAFAGLYWRTRTLWAAIAAHALNNAIALWLLRLQSGA